MPINNNMSAAIGSAFARLQVHNKCQCCYCGRWLSQRAISWDHIVPKSKGGETTGRNLRAVCRAVNQARGNTPDDIPSAAVLAQAMRCNPQSPETKALTRRYDRYLASFDWSQVDWSKSNKELRGETGISLRVIYRMRLAHTSP